MPAVAVAIALALDLGGSGCLYTPTYEGSLCAKTQPPSCPPGYACDISGFCRGSALPIQDVDGSADPDAGGTPSQPDVRDASDLGDGAADDRPPDLVSPMPATGGASGTGGMDGSGRPGTGGSSAGGGGAGGRGAGGRASGGAIGAAGLSGSSGGRGIGGGTAVGSGGLAASGGRGTGGGTGGATGSGGRGTGGTLPIGSGGTLASGGAPGSGGIRGTGGIPSTGGAPGTGGAPACVLGTTQNCGTCGHACAGAHATLACSNALPSGICVVSACVGAPWRDCNAIAADGCEQDIQNDVEHCGSCATPCAGHNATWACTGGACAIRSCAPGFDDCNGLVSDGCEANLATDSANCGRCGGSCAVLGVVLRCVNGACSLL